MFNKFKEQYEKDQQTNKLFDKLYRKSLQHNVIDKNQFESLCKTSIKLLVETKNECFFYKLEI